ncbi:T9SS type A sorting domain-containing protein [Bacteroidota bacterium]
MVGIEGDLQINNNSGLQNLTGLDNIIFIGGSLEITANENIESLEAINGLTEIQGPLKISNNSILESLSGLENIDAASIMNLTITNNDSLYECHVASVCYFLGNPGGAIVISNNNSGCDSAQQVASLCLVGIQSNPISHEVSIYPNPADEILNITCDNTVKIDEIIICNHLGQKMLHQSGMQHSINISDYPSGLYIIAVEGRDWRIRRKLIVS